MTHTSSTHAHRGHGGRRRKDPPLRRPGENIDRANRPWRILTDQQVRDIRTRLAGPDAPTRAAVACEYGIHPSTVSQIATGRRRRRTR